MSFDGMANVHKENVMISVNNALCYIQRYRNNEFTEYKERIRDSNWFYYFFSDHIKFTSFVRYVIFNDPIPEKEIMIHTYMNYYGSLECSEILANQLKNLCKATQYETKYIYVNPEQAEFITKYKERREV